MINLMLSNDELKKLSHLRGLFRGYVFDMDAIKIQFDKRPKSLRISKKLRELEQTDDIFGNVYCFSDTGDVTAELNLYKRTSNVRGRATICIPREALQQVTNHTTLEDLHIEDDGYLQLNISLPNIGDKTLEQI